MQTHRKRVKPPDAARVAFVFFGNSDDTAWAPRATLGAHPGQARDVRRDTRQGVGLIQCSAALHSHPIRTGDDNMLKWALIFAIISLVAGVLGFTGIAAGAASIAKVLFFIFVVLFVLFLVLGVTVFKAVD